MGRLTAERTDDLLSSKIRWLVASALEKASNDLPSAGRRSYSQFVEDLDVHDSFSKRIFELLVKETIQRRPRPQRQPPNVADEEEEESAFRPFSPFSPVESPASPRYSPRSPVLDPVSPPPLQIHVPRLTGQEEGATTRARRFEARLPYVGDLAGTPANAHTVSSNHSFFRSPLPHRGVTLRDPGFATLSGSREPSPSRIRAVNIGASHPNVRMRPRDPVAGEPAEEVEALDDSTGRTAVRRESMQVPWTTASNLLSPSDSSTGTPPLPLPNAARDFRDAIEQYRSHMRPPRSVPPPPQRAADDDFEAFTSTRRARRRMHLYDSDGDDVYERLGSSSSVAALSSLEHEQRSWDVAATRQRATSEELITMSEFLGRDNTDYRQRAEAEREAEMRRFQESETRATL